MSLSIAPNPLMFMLRQFLKSMPIKETAVPAERVSEEISALCQLLANSNSELRCIHEPKSGFIAYYVVPKDHVGLAGV